MSCELLPSHRALRAGVEPVVGPADALASRIHEEEVPLVVPGQRHRLADERRRVVGGGQEQDAGLSARERPQGQVAIPAADHRLLAPQRDQALAPGTRGSHSATPEPVVSCSCRSRTCCWNSFLPLPKNTGASWPPNGATARKWPAPSANTCRSLRLRSGTGMERSRNADQHRPGRRPARHGRGGRRQGSGCASGAGAGVGRGRELDHRRRDDRWRSCRRRREAGTAEPRGRGAVVAPRGAVVAPPAADGGRPGRAAGTARPPWPARRPGRRRWCRPAGAGRWWRGPAPFRDRAASGGRASSPRAATGRRRPPAPPPAPRPAPRSRRRSGSRAWPSAARARAAS